MTRFSYGHKIWKHMCTQIYDDTLRVDMSSFHEYERRSRYFRFTTPFRLFHLKTVMKLT